MRTDDERRRYARRLQKLLSAGVISALAVAYLVHFSAVANNAVDIPDKDGFVVYLASASFFQGGPEFEWLFNRHNEHYIAPTRLQGWFLYHLNGWDLISHQVMNFILYGFVLAVIIWIARRLQPKLPVWAIASFVLFLLSPLGSLNHAWAVQSHIHFTMLFFPLAACALFAESQRLSTLVLGAVCGWLAIFSQAGGAAATLVVLGCYAMFKGIQVLTTSSDAQRRRELLRGAFVLLALGAGIVFFLLDLRHGAEQPMRTMPWTWSFWHSLFNVVSYAFGYPADTSLWGAVCLLLVLSPVAGKFVLSRGRPGASFWAVTAMLFGVLAIIASIAFGRGAITSPRNFQLLALLVPFTFLAWRGFLADRPRLRVGASIVLWLICAYGYKDHLSLEAYREIAKERRANETAVREYYHGVGPVPLHLFALPRPVAVYLENAKTLNVSFAQRLSLADSSPPPKRAAGAQPVVGLLKSVDLSGHAEGWALDPENPSRSLDVELYLDGPRGVGRFLGTTVAGEKRPDVNQVTGYPGNHGFRFSLREAIADELPHTLHAYAVDSQSGKPHSLPGNGLQVLLRLKTHRPTGFLNHISPNGIASGWALDPDSPTEPIDVHFYVDGATRQEGGKYAGRITANQQRLDVNKVTDHPGDHGFEFEIPAEFRDGAQHKLFVWAIDPNKQRNSLLTGSATVFKLSG